MSQQVAAAHGMRLTLPFRYVAPCSLGPTHELAHLLDEYAYTSMVANCGQRQALDQALGLMQVGGAAVLLVVAGLLLACATDCR